MSENHSTAPVPSSKPTKPYPDFPLFPHATKRWAKKIRGKLYYFGPWDDWKGALENYNEKKDALYAGRKPRSDTSEGVTVKNVVNAFLRRKKERLEAGELSAHTWAKYKTAADLIIAAFGKHRLAVDLDADDFANLRKRMANKWGPHRLGDMIQNVRSIFKHAHDSRLLPLPVCFGPDFVKPSRKVMRVHRAERGPNLFTASEVRRLIDAAGPTMRAMILLGINAGFGNADCGTLPLSAVDLEKGIIDFPRPKTGIPRRCALWPETIAAIRAVLEKRPAPKDEKDAGLVFLTLHRGSWFKEEYTSPIVLEMRKLLKKLGINGRQRLGFYTLRHTFRTVADESKDQPAVDFIMGHEVPHMSAVYRETISDERLRAVAEHVRGWLFPPTSVADTSQIEQARDNN